MKKSSIIIIAILLFALVLLVWISVVFDIKLISEAILSITAIIVLWYAHETSLMRKEIKKQNILSIRPIITLKLLKKKVYYHNKGAGPALNITLGALNNGSILDEDEKLKNVTALFEVPPISVLFQKDKEEMKIFGKNISNGKKGTISEPDLFFERGKKLTAIVKYNDFEGTKYLSKIKIQSGRVIKISFE